MKKYLLASVFLSMSFIAQAENKPMQMQALKGETLKEALNSPLTASEDMDAAQISHEMFTKKIQNCQITSGQEIIAPLTSPALGDDGLYLISADCSNKKKQFIYLVHGNELKDILYTEMRTSDSTRLVYQTASRRLFVYNGNKLREVEWQPLAMKASKKSESKTDLYKGLFGSKVPKAPLPNI